MLTRLTAAVAAAALFAAAPAAAQPATNVVPIPCERACMEGLAGKVLNALAAHDAKSLPLAKNARYTENGQEMGFDNGLWQTMSKVGAYRHVFADPASGQFGVFATMDENGHGLVLGMRVRLELGWISEIELITYRTGAGPAWNDAGYGNLEKMGTPKPVWNAAPSGRAPLAPGAGQGRQLLLRRHPEQRRQGLLPVHRRLRSAGERHRHHQQPRHR